jgi:hypothetical protein
VEQRQTCLLWAFSDVSEYPPPHVIWGCILYSGKYQANAPVVGTVDLAHPTKIIQRNCDAMYAYQLELQLIKRDMNTAGEGGGGETSVQL